MTQAATFTQNISLGGLNISKTIVRTADHPNPYAIDLPPGKVVTSWVKTDANTAACNLPGGHGYANGNFDVYWVEDGERKMRFGVPGTISTNALSLDGGSGDDFPASATANIVVCRQIEINTAIDGDAIKLISMCAEYVDQNSTAVAHIDLQDVSPATVAEIDLRANNPKTWDVVGGSDNPFTGDPIVASYASNGSATEAAVLKILSLEDSTP